MNREDGVLEDRRLPHGAAAIGAAAVGLTGIGLGLLAAVLMTFTMPSATTAAGTPESEHYIPAAEVKAAFDKGAVLVNSANYMVHASRREAAGMAEVHVRDTDIIHVLEGSAVLVIGGSVVEGTSTADDELRGASIQGGVERHLVPGDVLVVPKGMPHWFREVRAPFLYYVVKVR